MTVTLTSAGGSGAPAPAASILLNVTQTTASSGSITQAIPAGTYSVVSSYPCQLTINSIAYQILGGLTPTVINVPSSATSYSVINLSVGLNWAIKSVPTPTYASASFTAIVWTGSIFYTCTSNSAQGYTSPDGITWTIRTAPNLFTSVGWNGTVFLGLVSGGTTAYTSPDGITWTSRTLAISTTNPSVAWNGTVFVVQGGVSSATCQTSPDGITWTSRTMPSTTIWSGVIWNGSQFFAWSSTTSAATSPDGITWTARTTSMGSVFNASVAWGNSIYVLDGSTGGSNYQTSPDGITWTSRIKPGDAAQQMVGLFFYQGLFFMTVYVGNVYSNSATIEYATFTSPDGINWTLRTTFPTLYGATPFISAGVTAIGNNVIVAPNGAPLGSSSPAGAYFAVSTLLPNPIGIYAPPVTTI